MRPPIMSPRVKKCSVNKKYYHHKELFADDKPVLQDLGDFAVQ